MRGPSAPPPEAILAEARSWLGTPFLHRGRCKGVGVDCVGLAVGIARALGLPATDSLDYPRRPSPQALERALAAQLLRLDPAAARPGDLLRLAPGGKATHLAILTRLPDGRPGLLHAHAPSRRVVEHGWDGRWPGPAVDAWRLIGDRRPVTGDRKGEKPMTRPTTAAAPVSGHRFPVSGH